jgi:cystathionine beta-lyase/cystathionine gamma-synthase
MVAFELRADQRGALAFIDHLELITAATSLGDAASLVLYPPLTSHRNLSPDGLRQSGIGED